MIRDWVNPYVSRVGEHSGRIVSGEDLSAVCAELSAIVSGQTDLLVELGSGSGNHLIELARQNPGRSCVGFELRFKRAVRTIEKSKQQSIDNTYVVKFDAREFANIFPPGSISTLYVNFPDPWPKMRSRKHRLISEQFIDNLDRALSLTGKFRFKTDHAEYFESALRHFQADKRFRIVSCTRDLHASEFAAENIVTEFERLFLSQKKMINFFEIRR